MAGSAIIAGNVMGGAFASTAEIARNVKTVMEGGCALMADLGAVCAVHAAASPSASTISGAVHVPNVTILYAMKVIARVGASPT